MQTQSQNNRVRSNMVNLIASVFIFLFIYTAISKLIDFRAFQNTLSNSPLIGKKSSFLAVGLPVLELGIAILLFRPASRKIGFYASFILMVLFSGYIAYMLLANAVLPCACGGVLKAMDWKTHLVFNLFFTILAFAGIQLIKNNSIYQLCRSTITK
jgi:hypothetical protein